MRIACVGYRDWALRIYDALARLPEHAVLVIRNKEQYTDQAILEFEPDVALFYGWSWKVSPGIIHTYDSVMLHPAPLPKYRGGSPIQNQILAGETVSAVTLFLMGDELDAGDIIAQEPLSLEGPLESILGQMSHIGLRLTLDFLRHGYKRTPQDHSQATYCRRRRPEDSEITLEELRSAPGRYLYDKIRMLGDPYPNAFIHTSDGLQLFIKHVELSAE